MEKLVDALIASPIGACMLALFEQQQRPHNHPWFFEEPASDPDHVRHAVDDVSEITFGAVCAQAVYASDFHLNPWSSATPAAAYAAYLHVEQRRPIAQAIADRFGAELQRPIDLTNQEWWLHSMGAAGREPLFQRLDEVYSNGELSWGALSAYGSTPPEVLDIGVGEAPPPHSRWSLPITAEPRVFEIHRPRDWHRLCTMYPGIAKHPPASWSMPPYDLASNRELLRLPHQHAATRAIDTYVSPRWSAVAVDYDAVHLSWVGFITSEGHVCTHGPNTTMLRFWEREVTMWLKDCFGEPAPIPLEQRSDYLVDVAASPARRAQDELEITKMLGR